jgi:hypothetical protein
VDLDLDKARAARAEVKGEGHTIVFGGVHFSIPAEVSLDAAEAMASGDYRTAMAELLNGQVDKFFELKPTVDDMDALVNGVDIDGEHFPGLAEMYVPGSTVGESLASPSSSTNRGKKSRQRSSASTASS